jgi:hypothetical protein
MYILDSILYSLQEGESKEYFSPCRRECRKVIKDSAKSLKLSISSEVIGGVFSYITGTYFLGLAAKSVSELFNRLTGVNGLFKEYCSIKCNIKKYEKVIRREEKRGIDSDNNKNKLNSIKKHLNNIENIIEESMLIIERKDKIKYDKLRRLKKNIDDSVELFSL